MEKSRAIELLKLAVPIKALTQQGYADFVEAVNMGMDALKAQLSQGGTTKDAISRQWLLDCINEGWIKFDTDKDANRFIHLVRDIAPTAQPELDSETLIRTIETGITATNSNDVYSLGMRNGMRWCKSLIDGAEPKFEDDVMSVDDGKELPSVQPEPAIPLSWIEKHIEWHKSLDNEFANLAAAHISVMVNKWRDEQNETD